MSSLKSRRGIFNAKNRFVGPHGWRARYPLNCLGEPFREFEDQFEVIIMDGCWITEAAIILTKRASLAFSRIAVILNPKNFGHGPTVAGRLGIAFATLLTEGAWGPTTVEGHGQPVDCGLYQPWKSSQPPPGTGQKGRQRAAVIDSTSTGGLYQDLAGFLDKPNEKLVAFTSICRGKCIIPFLFKIFRLDSMDRDLHASFNFLSFYQETRNIPSNES